MRWRKNKVKTRRAERRKEEVENGKTGGDEDGGYNKKDRKTEGERENKEIYEENKVRKITEIIIDSSVDFL